MRLSLTLDANTGQLRGQLDNASRSVGGFAHDVETSSRRANQAFSRTRQGIASISRQLGRMQTIAATAFAFTQVSSGIQSLFDLSDAYSNTTARLHLATNSQKEYTTAYSELVKITRNSLGDFGATVDLYSSMSRATQDLHLKQSTLLTVTDAVNKAIRVSGASSISAEAALVQLGQGLASGTLRGEELNSILEQTPRIARMIADGAGIAFGDLRKVAAQGGLTSEVVIRALKKEAATVNEEFNRIPPTIAGASLQVHNSMMQIWGDFTTTSGASNGLANSILFVADNLKAMVAAGVTAIKILAAAYVSKLITAKLASIAATRAEQAAVIAEAQAAVTAARATVAATERRVLMVRANIAAVAQLAAAERALAVASGANNRTLASRIGLSRRSTRESLAGLGQFAVASNLLMAAWAGWEIGRYLSDQFGIVKQAGIAMAGGLDNLFVQLKFVWGVAGAGLSLAFNKPFDLIKVGFAKLVGVIAKGLIFLKLGSYKSNKNMLDFADSLNASASGAAAFTKRVKELNAERKKGLATNNAFYASEFADAGKPKKPRIGNKAGAGGGLNPLNPLGGNGIKKSLSDSQSLIKQLSTSFDDSFTKISDKYVTTWEALVATQGEGSAKVKALESAYQGWLDGLDQKEIAKEKAKSVQIIDIHSAKFARMDAMGKAAFGSDKEKLMAALDVKQQLLKQEEDRTVAAIEAQGGNAANVHAYFDEQRISAAQKVADKLGAIEQAKTDKALAIKQQEIDARNALIAKGEQAATDLKGQFQQLARDNQQVHLSSLLSNTTSYLDTISTKNEKTGKRDISFTKANSDQKVAFVRGGLKMVSGLMASHNKKAFEIGKAAAIADATVSTIVAVMKAWKDYGWPVGAALGVGIAAAGAMNVAKIASTKFGGGATGGVAAPTMSAGGGGSAPAVGMNAQTGLPQSPSFNPSPQQPTTPSIQIVQHITAPNAQIGAADAIQQAANQGAQQALNTIAVDFASNGTLRQSLAV